jgi:cytochrome c oxidase subunit 3
MMSTVTQPPTDSAPPQPLGYEGRPHLAHHFESPQQQLDAGKLGMWIFLVTEVLFFGGLFVAYAVYRNAHPEIFAYAHQYLDQTLGAVNTVVLILSSLTMAWAVRCAQLGQRRGLVWCLALTLSCAAFFLGVKAVEYSTKWDEGLLWARAFHPATEHAIGGGVSTAFLVLSTPAVIGLAITAAVALRTYRSGRRNVAVVSLVLAVTCLVFFLGAGSAKAVSWAKHGHAPAGTGHDHHSQGHDTSDPNQLATPSQPALGGVFFSIYFAMTGVHALHMVAGMGVIAWLVACAQAGRFGSQHFAPIDYVGLYWHLVDLVWIFLFPLFYLIQ